MANEIIRPSALPVRTNPVPSEVVPSDNNVTVGGVSWEDGVNAAVPPASEAESVAGVINSKRMTPLTTKQAIDAQVPPKINSAIAALNLGSASQSQVSDFATAAQGALADTAVQPSRTVSTGAGLTGGGTLATDQTISLNSASIAALAKADTSVQAVNGNSPDGAGNVVVDAEFTQERDTIAQAASSTFAPSVSWVRTSGFHSSGDSGGALYNRSSGPAGIGKFQSADGAWWEISEREIYLKQLGAVEMADVTAILQRAVEMGRNIIVDGVYLVTDKITHDGPLNIRGLSDTSELHWPADAVDGGIEVTPQSWYDYIEIKDVRLTTAAIALWNAVDVDWQHLGTVGIPYFWVRCRILSNRIMGALTLGGINDASRGWLNGVRLNYVFSAEVMDNFIFGAWDGTFDTNGINAFQTYAGINVPDQSLRTLAYLRMERNSIFYAKYGVQQYNIEGTWFVDNDIQVTWRGLHYQNTISPVNQHRIYGNHIGVYETQILVVNARQVLIENNEISYRWGRTDTASVTLINLDGVLSGSIVGNSIRGNIFNLDAVQVTGILLISNGRPVGNTQQISIDANQFQNLRYAYEIRATAADNIVGPSNTYLGILTAISTTVNNTATQPGIMGAGVLPLPVGQNPALYLRGRSAAALAVGREDADGVAVGFYRQGTIVGNINLTGTATAYNTSSDASLKNDKGELTFEDAKRIVELVTIHSFDWKSTGESDAGVFAQELYEIYPRAVTKGGWFLLDGSEGAEGDDGAYYLPWSVDYSKLVPVMFRVLQGLVQ